MDLQFKATKLKKVSDIQISDRFFNRIKSGVASLDSVFGGSGILPGMTFTMAAAPGCGKTTFFLQTLEVLQGVAYSTAYVSCEECEEQLAFTCNRLNVKDVPVANENTIEGIVALLRENDLDLLVIDSFQGLTSSEFQGSSKKMEEYITNQIVRTAQETNTAIGIIMHVTKSGQYKGSTHLPHTVDANFRMAVDPNANDVRVIDGTKNRFGGLAEVSFMMTAAGLDLFSDVASVKAAAEASKLGASIVQLADEDGMIATRDFTALGEGSYPAGQKIITSGLRANIIKQKGRGKYELTDQGKELKNDLVSIEDNDLDNF